MKTIRHIRLQFVGPMWSYRPGNVWDRFYSELKLALCIWGMTTASKDLSQGDEFFEERVRVQVELETGQPTPAPHSQDSPISRFIWDEGVQICAYWIFSTISNPIQRDSRGESLE